MGTSTRPSASWGNVRKYAMMRSDRRGSPTTDRVFVSTPIFFDISADRFSRTKNACGFVHASSCLAGMHRMRVGSCAQMFTGVCFSVAGTASAKDSPGPNCATGRSCPPCGMVASTLPSMTTG